MVVILIEALALMLFISDLGKQNDFSGKLERPSAGGDSGGESVVLDTGEKREEVYVSISPTKRTEEEIMQIFERAREEIDETILGKNESPDKVYEKLEPKGSYAEGAVNAVWEFDNYEIINPAGEIILENVREDTLINASCTLTCEEKTEVYTASFLILKPNMDSENGFSFLVEESLKEADEKTIDSKELILPQKVGGQKVKWEAKDSNRAVQLALLGAVCGVVLFLAGKEDKKRKQSQRLKKMEADYPEIVSMLSLYVGAGISVKGAFGRIFDSYEGRKTEEERPGFEGVGMLKRDMDDGKGELDAYRDFGKRMGHKDYRKLSILLSQNLRKGSAQLIDQLEKEEHAAFEERKVRAKIAGEEASTKLLLPMMGLLVIVMIVLIFPAIQGINI